MSAATYGSDGSITDAELLGIDDGLTTQIPVGGGAGVGMVWTTATGTGAPVRAGSPTMTGVPLAPTIGLSNLTNLKVPKHVDDATGLADTTITVSANNEVTNASQPSFLAYNSVTDANVTGDGTPFTVIFDAEVFDQNANFDGTSTFTAPVTGKYRFTAVVLLGELAANHTSLELYINTSNRDYYHYGVGSIALQQAVSVSVLADMDATDTAVITVAVTGGSIVVDVIGGAGTDHFTYFCGELVN